MSGLISLTVALLVAANFWLWLLAFHRWRAGRALVDFERRRAVPWTPWDLAGVALGYLASNAAVGYLVIGSNEVGLPLETSGAIDPTRMPALLMGAAAVNLATLTAAIVWIRERRGADWRDLGLDPRRLTADVFLGLAAFAVVSVPVYAMQAGLTQLVPSEQSEHPVVKAWQALPEPGWALRLSSIISVVIVAPLAEEFLFRGLLQGWLESLGGVESSQEPAPSAAIQAAGPRRRWTPIVLSSAVFALMHVAQGPAVVPLFFFALALGYLYRQTHRLWPSVVLHLCLNACTLAMLWLAPPR